MESHRWMKRALRVLLLAPLVALLLLAGAQTGQAREIIDMAGRTVTLPDKISRIYAAEPYTNVVTYMVAPEMLVGNLSLFGEEQKRFLRPEVAGLPLLGGNPGQRTPVNMEAVMAAKPDFALVKGNAQTKNIEATVNRYGVMGLPVVFIDLDRIDDYPAGLEFLGKVVGREDKAKTMADYARKILAGVDQAVATIPEDKRVRVYYAESADGLATECDQSFHADAIKRAGGKIVHECILKTHMGMEKVAMEQVIAYDPDVIVAQDPHFAAMAAVDPRWQDIKAVRNHRILTVPRTPFNWIDRPPAATRIIGVPWLAAHFYPQAYKTDLGQEIREFHKLFMGIDISDADIRQWTE